MKPRDLDLEKLVKRLVGMWEDEEEEKHIFHSDGKYEIFTQERPFEGQWSVCGDKDHFFLEVCLSNGLVEWHRIKLAEESASAKPGDLLLQNEDCFYCMGKVFHKQEK